MTNQEIFLFFNEKSIKSNLSAEELIISMLKQKFGFPISYTPEGMEKPLILSNEENLALYQTYTINIMNKAYANIGLLGLQITKDLDQLYDKYLDL